MATSVSFQGWNEWRKKVKDLPAVLFDELDGEVEDAARMWEELAKNATTPNVKQNRLRPEINAKPVALMHYEVTSGADYSPYLEWGTGTRVSVPADLKGYALQFKGQKQVIGSRPYPFFFIHTPIIQKSLNDNIKRILTREH